MNDEELEEFPYLEIGDTGKYEVGTEYVWKLSKCCASNTEYMVREIFHCFIRTVALLCMWRLVRMNLICIAKCWGINGHFRGLERSTYSLDTQELQKFNVACFVFKKSFMKCQILKYWLLCRLLALAPHPFSLSLRSFSFPIPQLESASYL